MTAKTTNILYWIFTILFAGFMASTAIPDILKVPEAMTFITKLGYPEYFIPFIGVAKLLGSIAIVIPGYPRIKEWAYAGLAYDLIAASYSVYSTEGWQWGQLFMVLPFTVFILSYTLYHKRKKA